MEGKEASKDLIEEQEMQAEAQDLPENILTFKAVQKQMEVPFCLYVDFEAFIVKDPLDDTKDRHEVSGFGCLRVSSMQECNNNEVFVYSGPNVMEKFYEHIDKEHKEICELLNINKPMLPLTDEEKRTHKAAKHCKECDAQFTRKNHK